MFHRKDQRKETSRRSIISGSPRIGIEGPFQAHLALESIFDFRLICGLENALILENIIVAYNRGL
jgi:hypothetical protein